MGVGHDDTRLRVSIAVVVAGFALAACHHDASSDEGPTEAAPHANVSPPSSVPSPADATAQEMRRMVLAWSEALDRHDTAALSRFYGEQVLYYGRELPKAAVLRAKQAAFRAETTFHQQVMGDIDITQTENSAIAGFLKRSGAAGRARDVRAKLVIRASGASAPLIVEETDAVTESNRGETRRTECEVAAARAVNDLPEVKRMVVSETRAADESGGRAHYGSVGPIDDPTGGFSVGLGIHTDERFEAAVWYAVDRSGLLSVSVLGSDVTLAPDVLRAVQKACPR